MTKTVRIDTSGRIGLPKALRDELHLSSGDTLDISIDGDRIMLRPRRNRPRLTTKQGAWVFSTGQRMVSDETGETLGKIREHRDRHNAGQIK